MREACIVTSMSTTTATTATSATAGLSTDEDCMHGMPSAFCSICRKAAGFATGANRDRFRADCTVVAFSTLVGVDYAEAAEYLADEVGYKPGKGLTATQQVAAYQAAGVELREVTGAVSPRNPPAGRNFLISAKRGNRKVGHAWAVVAGEAVNALGYDSPNVSIRFRMFEVFA